MQFKVAYWGEKEYRLVNVTPPNFRRVLISFEETREKIASAFGLTKNSFDILYLDIVGDTILLNSDFSSRDLSRNPESENLTHYLYIRKRPTKDEPTKEKTTEHSKPVEPTKVSQQHQLCEETLRPISSNDNPTAHLPTMTPSATASSSTAPFPGLTEFVNCLQGTFEQIGKEYGPLQRTATQRSQEHIRQASSIAISVLDNALRSAAETATHLHQTVSPMLQRHPLYPTPRSYQANGSKGTNKTPEDTCRSSLYRNLCYTSLSGSHWVCDVCSDYHTCMACRNHATRLHNPSHTFRQVDASVATPASSDQPLTVSQDHPSPTSTMKKTGAVHENVVCDHCGATIVGIRYKCGHCPDFDLCEACEPLLTHDQRHVFLKIRRPLSRTRSMVTTLLPAFDYTFRPTGSTTHEKPEAVSGNELPAYTPTATAATPTATNASGRFGGNAVDGNDLHFGTSNGLLSATFMDDVNLPDGSEVLPGQRFLKMWKIKNDGRVRWPTGTTLIFSGGDILRPYPPQYDVHTVITCIAPGEEVHVAVELVAPHGPGRHVSYFRLASPEGVRFGDRLWCDVNVTHSASPNLNLPASQQRQPQQHMSPTVDTFIQSPVQTTVASSTMIYPDPNNTKHDDSQTADHRSSISSMMTTPTAPSVCTTVTNENGTTDYEEDNGNDDVASIEDPFQDPYQIYHHGSRSSENARSIKSQTGSVGHINQNDSNSDSFASMPSTTSRSSTVNYVVITENATMENASSSSDSSAASGTKLSLPNEKSPTSGSAYTYNNLNSDEFEWVENNQPLRGGDESKYAPKLAQLHEMGITYCDDLALKLLIAHDGDLDVILPIILESYYPD